MPIKSDILRELSHASCTAKQMKKRLGVDGKKLAKALAGLEAAGKIVCKGRVYALAAGKKGIPGTLVKLGVNYGFVAPADESGDIFVPGHDLKGAMAGDEVVVALFAHPRVKGSREGEVLRITRPVGSIVGTVAEEDGRLVLIPDKAVGVALKIKRSGEAGVKPGEMAAGEIIERGENHASHRLRIVAAFGQANTARNCIRALLYAAGLEQNFAPELEQSADALARAGICAQDIKGRRDLRGETIFTIDSAETKDIDDAIGIARGENGGYLLGVHIADVSHYVEYKSMLDKEAIGRGTSVYFGNSVIPMLPRALSNGICSLNPGEDRLAFSCLMELDETGRLKEYRFKKTVIQSRVKGVYSEVNALLAGQAGEELRDKYAQVAPALSIMDELYHKLDKRRQARGAIEIETDEAKLAINEEGVCIGLQKRHRGTAEKLIEEFMLLANTAAARCAMEQGLPFVYRVHEKPPVDKAQLLRAQMEGLGITFSMKGEIPTQKELAALLNSSRGTPLEYPVHNSVLRSMAKAKYETAEKGHYGLALKDYAHFTSPIRRYADLAVHRVLSAVAVGEKKADIHKKYNTYAEKAADSATSTELVAAKLERDCDACYKAEYMQQHLGQVFEGVISSAMPFGIYVALPNTAEGLVHISRLSSKPLAMAGTVALEEVGGPRRWQVGDRVKVRVLSVSIAQGNINFELADE